MTWKQVQNTTGDILRILLLSDGSGRLFMVRLNFFLNIILASLLASWGVSIIT